jgi:hypothetical protein
MYLDPPVFNLSVLIPLILQHALGRPQLVHVTSTCIHWPNNIVIAPDFRTEPSPHDQPLTGSGYCNISNSRGDSSCDPRSNGRFK